MRNIVNKRKASKKRFKALFKGIPIPTYSWQKIDDDLILIDYNDAAEKITKGMIKNYVGIKVSEMYKDRPEILEEFYRCANDRVNIFREIKYGYMSTGEENFLSVMYGFIPPDLVIVHTEDITEKKKALERLKKSKKELKALTLKLKQKIDISEEKYRTIFENTGTATIIVEEDTTISLVNEQFEALFGYSKEEIEWKKSWTEFIVEEDLERMKKLHYSRRKDPESTQRKYEFRLIDKKGNIRDIFIVIDLIPGTKKSVASLLDISERKKMEEKLKDSEEKYRYLFNNAQVGLYWSKISDGEFIECNDTFAKIFGYDTREECLANYNAVEHYIDPKARSELIEEIRVNKEVKNYEIHVTKKDGAPIWLSLSARMFEKEDRFEGAAIDITKRKIAEEKILESEEKYRLISENANDLISVFDEKLRFEYVNEKIHNRLMGYNKEDLIGKNGMILIHPDDQKTILETFRDLNNTGEGSAVGRIRHKNGQYVWTETKGKSFYDKNGVKKFLLITRDISERKQSRQKLIESEEKYREAYNRAEFYKDIFTHDINNILQSILSGTQISQLILDNHEEIVGLKLNAEIIKEQVVRGAKLVSNVRKLSQLEEAGRSLEKIEILKVLKNTVSFVKKSYKDKNLDIRIDSVEENIFVKANDFLEDVFENLLINSIRHNKNLIIEITVRILKEPQSGINYAKMEFLDNGVGVDEIMKEKIFQRGYSKEKGVYGTGLGLSLVRRIIETYDGKIWVEDRVEGDRSKGSNFVLLIPEVD